MMSADRLRQLADAELPGLGKGPRILTFDDQKTLARWAANARDALDMLEGALRFQEDQEWFDKEYRPLLAEFDRLFGDPA